MPVRLKGLSRVDEQQVRNEKLWLLILGPGAFAPHVSSHWQKPIVVTDTRQSYEEIAFQEYKHVVKTISRKGPQPHLCTPGLINVSFLEQSIHVKAESKYSVPKTSVSLPQTIDPAFSFIYLLLFSRYSMLLLIYCKCQKLDYKPLGSRAFVNIMEVDSQVSEIVRQK